MENVVYEAPVLVELGEFTELTRATFYGECLDFFTVIPLCL